MREDKKQLNFCRRSSAYLFPVITLHRFAFSIAFRFARFQCTMLHSTAAVFASEIVAGIKIFTHLYSGPCELAARTYLPTVRRQPECIYFQAFTELKVLESSPQVHHVSDYYFHYMTEGSHNRPALSFNFTLLRKARQLPSKHLAIIDLPLHTAGLIGLLTIFSSILSKKHVSVQKSMYFVPRRYLSSCPKTPASK